MKARPQPHLLPFFIVGRDQQPGIADGGLALKRRLDEGDVSLGEQAADAAVMQGRAALGCSIIQIGTQKPDQLGLARR